MADKAIPLSYLSKLKEQCDELYQAKGSGGGSVEYMTDEEVDALFVEDELIGTWVFKSASEISVTKSETFNVQFQYNGQSYNSIETQYNVSLPAVTRAPTQQGSRILFDSTEVWRIVSGSGGVGSDIGSITITNTSGLINREEFITWLKVNAVKQ